VISHKTACETDRVTNHIAVGEPDRSKRWNKLDVVLKLYNTRVGTVLKRKTQISIVYQGKQEL
ncbi:MAG TPA: hypothetical protein VE843_05155, partial [Ktedonobacteraceae bacterium]|nr:hypothetical protein [Ktedonobacteraceae bacterium]